MEPLDESQEAIVEFGDDADAGEGAVRGTEDFEDAELTGEAGQDGDAEGFLGGLLKGLGAVVSIIP